MMNLIHEKETYAILGACFEVYKEKGCGFLEAVYQECMEIELSSQNIPFRSRAPMQIFYKGQPLKQKYEPDFVCFGKVIVELKAVKELTNEHRAQIQNYLRATGLKVGLLINFGHYPKIEHERIVV